MPPLAPGLPRRVLPVVVLWQSLFWAPARSGGSEWTYEGPRGEDHWADKYPDCGGTAQSPVNIQTAFVQYEPTLPLVQPEGYQNPGIPIFTLTNNGHSVEMSLPETMFLHGLPKRYTAVQLHLHWGSIRLPGGSEHQVNDQSTSAELHIVHFNSDRYINITQAKTKPDGLAVLGVMIEIGDTVNPVYDNILSNLASVKYAGDQIHIPSFNVHQLLPGKLDHFFQYHGSLTTPPCHQSVLWTIFSEKVQIAASQLEILQGSLYVSRPGHTAIPMTNNVRATQSLNQRIVYSSFRIGDSSSYSAGEVVAIVFGLVFGFVGLAFIAHIIVKRIGINRQNARKEIVLKSSIALPPEIDTNLNA